MRNQYPWLGLLLLCGWSGCTALDDTPDAYVRASKPDLYYVVPLVRQTTAAFIGFNTANPKNPPLPLTIRVLTWANEGGNLFSGTLGEVELDSPAMSGNLLRWNGTALPPPGSSFDKVAVELRTFLPVVAYEPVPQAGVYALVEYDGAGVLDNGPWIDAVLQLWVDCLGDVGQLIPCHGLHHVVAPQIGVLLLSSDVRVQDAAMAEMISCLLLPSLYLAETTEGWRYRAPAPGEDGNWQPLEAHPTRGPFATPEEAARDAVATLGLTPRALAVLPELPADDNRLAGMRRLSAALHAETRRAQR
jgi:hypothetical protein